MVLDVRNPVTFIKGIYSRIYIFKYDRCIIYDTMVSSENRESEIERILRECTDKIDTGIGRENYRFADRWNRILLQTLLELETELDTEQLIKYSTLYQGYKDVILNKY